MSLSILLCFKNEEPFLDQTIASIQGQTETDFELIAVDDHSDDRSLELLSSYAQSDARIRVLSNSGRGIIDALRTAYAASSGELVTRHDADDVMPPYKLAELKRLLVASGRGTVSTGLVEYFSDGELNDGFVRYASWLNHLCQTSSHRQQLFKECVIASPNWMAYRADLDQIKAFYDTAYPEDYDLVFKFFAQDFKIVSSDKVTHLWRDHPTRASRTLDQYKDQRFYALKVQYFQQFYNPEIIVVWGAGPSGKALAKELLAQKVPFKWVAGNERKIGKVIYGVLIEPVSALGHWTGCHVLVAVSQRGSLADIELTLSQIEGCQYTVF